MPDVSNLIAVDRGDYATLYLIIGLLLGILVTSVFWIIEHACRRPNA
jgi:type III secretory pathway component EscT